MDAPLPDADPEQATEIRFFDTGSRLGRLRYFAYGWAVGLALSPLTIASIYEWLHGARGVAGGIFLVDWVIATPIHFTFIIRRLHDMGRSGWWSVVYAVSIPFSFLRFWDALQHVRPGPVYLLVNLVTFVFMLMLLFTAGTQGPNRFGPRPPPNSSGVVALAWSSLLLFVFVFIGIVLYVSTLDLHKLKVTRAVEAARANIYPVTRYYRENHRWPVDLASVEGTRTADAVIGSVGTISYPDGAYGIVVRLKYDGSVEVWTTDDGQSWHCGSPADAPLADKDLPDDCREEPPPAP